MDLSVFFAGTAGSVPTARRGLPAVLVRRGGDRILFDCGEGTQRQLVRSVGLTDLTEVFLTHFHADHWLGLPGLLKTFDLRARERPLAIYGPPGLKELMALALRAAETGHSTAGQAASLAREAEVMLLALTYFSTRYPISLLRDEARAVFAKTVLPRDFDTIEIPFPERGEPELVRWDERAKPDVAAAEALADPAA